jgi:hypothetical protein
MRKGQLRRESKAGSEELVKTFEIPQSAVAPPPESQADPKLEKPEIVTVKGATAT